MDTDTVNATFKSLREGCGLTLDATATLLGVTLRAVQYWDAGREPPADVTRKLHTLINWIEDSVVETWDRAPSNPDTPINLVRYPPETYERMMRGGIPHGTHTAMITTLLRTLICDGYTAVSVVMMNEADYQSWRDATGRNDTQTSRAEWAANSR